MGKLKVIVCRKDELQIEWNEMGIPETLEIVSLSGEHYLCVDLLYDYK